MKTLVAAAFLASSAVAYGQTPTAPQHENPTPQSVTRSPAATLPETKTVAPDATGVPVQQQTTGQAPNVARAQQPVVDLAPGAHPTQGGERAKRGGGGVWARV